jgi:hypothetical protein
MNLLRGWIRRRGTAAATLLLGKVEMAIPESVHAARPSLAARDDRAIAIGFRPEHVIDAGAGDEHVVTGRVELREGLGSECLVHVRVGVPDLEQSDALLVARLPPHTTLQIDMTAHLALDLGRASFFDLETGLAIV